MAPHSKTNSRPHDSLGSEGNDSNKENLLTLVNVPTLQKILLVAQYPSNHYPGNWVKPEEFIPERWLKDADPIYDADKKEAFNPFNHGGRDCIGKK